MNDCHLMLTLLGEFSITVDGAHLNLAGERPASLLSYLVLHRDSAVSRQQLAFTLWPDSTDSQARTNLRNLLHTLRQTFPHIEQLLVLESNMLRWRSGKSTCIDVAQFTDDIAAAAAADSVQVKLVMLESAVSRYKGDLLPGNYDDWIMPLREELRQQYLDALHQLVTLLEQQKNYQAAARYAQRLLTQDPLDERTYVQLMRLYAQGGDRAGLRRVYEACLTTLRQELNIEPAAATQAAYEQLLRLEAAPVELSTHPPPVQPPPPQPRPLPQPTTPFIGREAELGHIAELLADPACRLLTIMGPGGIGKTRLALEIAVGHQRVFADGAIWVPLMPVQSTEQVATAVADALGYRLTGTTHAASELSNVLKNKEMLLVCDNFEHVMEATAFLADILEKTASIKLLVTSQQSLAMQAEWRFELDALALPPEQMPASFSSNSAIQLFEQSARRVTSNFSLTDNAYPHVARICRLVGGMPLGIELAASWTRLLSCEEIADEIEKSLDFLTVRLQDVPARHRSLRAVFDYSWGLLAPTEQEALARLSLFRGGFTREAAARVASAALPLLSMLTDRSLVQRTAVGRYGLHSLMRLYASDALQSDREQYETTVQHHMEYYLYWLANKDAAMRSDGQTNAVNEIAVELANIRQAWQQAVVKRRHELLQNAAFSLFYFYELRGLLFEAKQVFQSAVNELTQHASDDNVEMWRAIATLRAYLTNFMLRLGEITEAVTALEPVVRQLEMLGDKAVLPLTLRYLGSGYALRGEYGESLSVLHRSLALHKQRNNPWETILTNAYVGMVMNDRGDYEEADPFIAMAVDQSRKLGDTRLIAYCLMLAGRANLLKNEQLDKACDYLEQSLAIGADTNDPYVVNISLTILGLVKRAQGDYVEARQLLENALELFKDADDWVGVERISVNLGLLDVDTGNDSTAKEMFVKMLRSSRHEHAPRYLLLSIISLAEIKQREGDPETALKWIYFALAHPKLDKRSASDAERVRSELEVQLDAAQIDAARAAAAQLSLTDIVADVQLA